MEKYRNTPWPSTSMPPGIPYIISNEAAERFSFYGMRTILVVFMVKYLWLMGDSPGTPMADAAANEKYHNFVAFAYLTPFFGAFLADYLLGKYRVIIWLSLAYCLGHLCLAFMGVVGQAEVWLSLGLWLIVFGSGGIKPCVSAHVGDQFGPGNQHLLTKIFNWFYFSINLGAFVSSMLTPWLLEWYGPHLAFGVPGILMLIATVCFWAGRYRFVHIPAKGDHFFKDLCSKEGLAALGKLSIIFLFVAMFWALFDQTGSSWVIQAEDMNLSFLGVEWLSSQVQALNPIFILIFIPFFTYLGYPAINRFFKLTPLRKIGIGMFTMVISFALVALVQEWIDAGQQPSIAWQLLAYVIITAAEVMVSIVCLEFSYTQAPKSLKSWVMALFLSSVFLGNIFTAQVNRLIQVKKPVEVNWEEEKKDTMVFAGFDGREGTQDDIIVFRNGTIDFAGKADLLTLEAKLKEAIAANQYNTLDSKKGSELAGGFVDPWGNAYRYTQINRRKCKVTSPGPDRIFMTQWDQGLLFTISIAEEKADLGAVGKVMAMFRPSVPWLETRMKELKIKTESEKVAGGPSIATETFVGGQTKLEGAAYFWFFTKMMLGAAVLFVVVAIYYHPKSYIYEEK
jgi:proton-dependent oligopeptide transporter, POT family